MFGILFEQVLEFFLFMLIGIVLCKKQVLPKEAINILSKLIVTIFLPAIVFLSFYKNFTLEKFVSSGNLIVIGFVLLGINVFIGLLYGKYITDNKYYQKVCIYSTAITNTSYVGIPLISEVFGQEALMQMLLFTIPTMIFSNVVGVALLTNKEKLTFQSLINPLFVFMFLGMICGIFRIPVPNVALEVFEGCGNCIAPIAMILTGAAVARFSRKHLIGNVLAYKIIALRMLILPITILTCAKLLGAKNEVMLTLLSVQTMPMSLNTVIFAETCGEDSTLGAGMACMSNVLGIITIPIFFHIFM